MYVNQILELQFVTWKVKILLSIMFSHECWTYYCDAWFYTSVYPSKPEQEFCLQIKQPVTCVWNQTGQQSFKYVILYVRGMFSKYIFGYCLNDCSCFSIFKKLNLKM